MYHGGTNFGRTASAFVITSYYDQAPIDDYAQSLYFQGTPITLSLGHQQEAHVFNGQSGQCAAFLLNSNNITNAVVQFQNSTYDLPPRSISILPDCKNVAFNTAKASKHTNSTRSIISGPKFNSAERWEEFEEHVPQFDETSLRSNMLLEHTNTTKDTSDYLWYTVRFQQNSTDAQSVLSVDSLGHVLHAFINGVLVGGREVRVDRRRVVEAGAGSGAGSRSEGGTEEVEPDSCRLHLSYTKPGLNLSTIVGDSEKIGRRDTDADGIST
ncbi:hypothetical protein F0562_028026 [Nyssa sinensis]|uniref:Beta-galactosidase n=1 Tax=Nyssa sinensis TaxID=561372 RepID=A0A5J5B702_9ASTE|nr:hypothetical protein F0562_028026 [Nyssa sinensis]